MTQTTQTTNQSACKIAEYIQCMDTQAIAAAARGDIDLLALFSAELASRGMSRQGTWVGFELDAAEAAVG